MKPKKTKHRYHSDHSRLAEGQFKPQRIQGKQVPPPELDEWDWDDWGVDVTEEFLKDDQDRD
jgi:hypothetical protein|tara:strand:+ start:175 stop:360 length:186 start_codon:yes stop_codon:yes gene_type:complete